MTTQEVISIFSSNSYAQPNWEEEFGEMEREVNETLLPQGTAEDQSQIAVKMLSDFKKASLQPLSESIWSQLQNTDSYSIPVGGALTRLSLSQMSTVWISNLSFPQYGITQNCLHLLYSDVQMGSTLL